MTGLIEWLLDLDHIRLGRDAPLSLEWNLPVEPWVLATFALIAAALIVLLYRRESPSWGKRLAPTLLRAGLLGVVLVALGRPTLVLQRNRVEPAYVAVLLDESRSMDRKETYADPQLAGRITEGAGLASPEGLVEFSRLELLRAALLDGDAAPLRALLERNALQLYTFAATASAAASAQTPKEGDGPSRRIEQAAAGGGATDLAGAVRKVFDDAHGRRLAAVIIAGDGRCTTETDVTALAELAGARRVPILAVRIGSPAPVRDLRVGPLRAEESVFAGDLLAVEARVEAVGLDRAMPVTVQLVDERSGLVAASETVALGPAEGGDGAAAAAAVELRTKPTRPGLARYRVETPALPDEISTENNADLIEVMVLEEKLSVLYVEGYPRFEYRYLKNALVREPSMRVSVLLLEADDQFVQEGTEPIRRFPETPEELNRYDVVLFGDVDPLAGWLSPSQLRMLLDFVGNTGGGFGVIAGERYAPRRFRGTPLEKLLPVRLDPDASRDVAFITSEGFNAQLTPDGESSRVLRFASDLEESRRLFKALPPLYWYAPSLGPRPGATVLVEHPSARAAAGLAPLVVLGRYGAGKIFYQATDDTWRWRRHTGEFLHDTYWVRITRELMRPRGVGRDKRLVIRTDQRDYAYGERVEIEVEVLDSELLSELGDELSLVLADSDETAVMRTPLARVGDAVTLFEGSCVPPRIGSFALSVENVAPRPGDKPAAARIRVSPTDPESAQLEADHAILERLTQATGGRMVELNELTEVFASIPDRSVRIPDDVAEPLWDSRLIWLVFGLMITGEWVLRKAMGML